MQSLYTNVRTNIDDFALYGQEMTNQVAHSHSDFNRTAHGTIILCILIDFFVRYDADINLYLFSIQYFAEKKPKKKDL